MGKSRHDLGTPDLFRDWQPPREVAARLAPEVTKGGTLDVRVAKAVAHALAASGKSRAEIAALMSEYLGERLSENMLDAYASPARETHKITLERFIALMDATGCYGLLAFICQFAGYVAVPERYGDVIELWREDREIEERTRRRDALMGRVRSLR